MGIIVLIEIKGRTQPSSGEQCLTFIIIFASRWLTMWGFIFKDCSYSSYRKWKPLWLQLSMPESNLPGETDCKRHMLGYISAFNRLL